MLCRFLSRFLSPAKAYIVVCLPLLSAFFMLFFFFFFGVGVTGQTIVRIVQILFHRDKVMA